MSDITYLLKNLTELHTHLGACTSPHVLWELAHEQGINVGEKDYWKFIESATVSSNGTLEDFLKFHPIAERIQSSPYAIERAVHSSISHMYRLDNIHKVEIRYNPMFRNKGGEQDLDKIVLASTIAVKKVCIDYPVQAGIILMMDRRFSIEQNAIVIDKAIKYKNDGVVAVDIGGPTKNVYPMADLKPLIDKAKAGGLKITIHTGEVTDDREMEEVIDTLQPDRIGHGVAAVNSPAVMKKLAERKIVLETCPSSNIRTSVVNGYKDFKQIYETFDKHGVIYTVNTDGAALLDTTLPNEFEQLYKAGAITSEQISRAIATASKASFI